MSGIHKFPRTRHIRGSRFQHGDHDMEAVPWEELRGKHLVIEEKIDGGNFGVSFVDGEMKLQSRGHYLRGGPREREFEFAKLFCATYRDAFEFLLHEDRYVLYSENLLAKHSLFYDALPHYLFEFDIYDTFTNDFLSTDERSALFSALGRSELPIAQVPVLTQGKFDSLEELKSFIKPSLFFSGSPDRLGSVLQEACREARADHQMTLAQTDKSDFSEGLYVKWEENGRVMGRYKFVRESFTAHILEGDGDHWHDRPMVHNQLAPGAYDRAFGIIT